MKFDISRQTLFSAALILLALAACAIGFGPLPTDAAGGADASGGAVGAVGAGGTVGAGVVGGAGGPEEVLTVRLLGDFLVRHTVAGRLLLFVLLIATGLSIGRTGIRYSLYPAKTCIGISLFGFLGCAMALGDNMPVAIVTAYCWARTLSNYLGALRNGYAFDRLFRGSMFLGAIPLLQPALTPLVAVLPIVLLLFKRTTREGIVAFVGLLFVPLTAGYICWACGLPFLEPLRPIVQATHLGGPMPWTQLPLHTYPVLGLTLLLVLYTLGCFIGDRHSSDNRKLVLLPLLFYMYLLCAALFVLPFHGSSVTVLTALMAVVMSLLLPYLFVRLQSGVALTAYAALAVLSLLGVGLAIVL